MTTEVITIPPDFDQPLKPADRDTLPRQIVHLMEIVEASTGFTVWTLEEQSCRSWQWAADGDLHVGEVRNEDGEFVVDVWA